MATTATISISSDIAPGFGGISESMTLTQAGTVTDIDSTSGFQIRKLAATGAVDLITMANELVEPKDSVAAKIFIGKLFGGDWMMMPLTCIDADDVTVNPDTADTVVLEYVMFFEEA